MPARDAPLTFVIAGRFDPRWSPLGRALRRFTGDRLRAEALQIVLLTGATLAWLMAVYAGEALAAIFAPAPLALGIGLAGVMLVLAGVVGFRPRAVVRGGPAAVHVERGRERLRLPYASLAKVEVVEARSFHRHHRRYARVRPVLGAAAAPVLLLHMKSGKAIVALGLRSDECDALRRHIDEQSAGQRRGATQQERRAPELIQQ